MLTEYSMRLPGQVYSGENAIEKLGLLLKGHKKAAVFTDKGIMSTGLTDRPVEIIRQSGIEAVVIDSLVPEPSCDDAQRVIEEFYKTEADAIVAIGGGSVMDMAKLASILADRKHTVRELVKDPSLGKKSVMTVMIPTTAGTGSEATPNSIVLVPEEELKVGIVNSDMIADAVVLDAVMIAKLPRKIAAATGIDALAHAIECYTSNKANPFSDMYALEALDLIMNNIEKACDDANAMKEKNNMLIAAFYAGIAIAASGTTAVHALSYPLGGKYHIAHGVSNAMLLVPVMEFNEPAIREKLAAAFDRVNHEASSFSTEEKSEKMIERLLEIVKHLDIPTSLSEYGVPKDDLEVLVNAGMQVTRLLNNNMRKVTAEDARYIYSRLLA